MQIVFLIMTMISLFFLTKNILSSIFNVGNYKLQKKRLRQLEFKNEIDGNENELINKLTKPVISHVLPKIKIKNFEEIEKDLKFVGWNKKFTAQQFIAIKVITKALAVLMTILFWSNSKAFAVIWGVVLFNVVGFLLNNKVESKKEALIVEFPSFVRITHGYLSANMPLVKAIEESIKFVSEDWQIILQQFVVDAELSGVEYALENLKETVNIFEVKEFISLIKLTLEQGGAAKEGFDKQADKAQQMLKSAELRRIQKRGSLSTIIQGPLLLCIMATFALPIINSMTNLNSM